MNKERLKLLLSYCDCTFSDRNVSVVRCLDRLDADAKSFGLTKEEYLDKSYLWS